VAGGWKDKIFTKDQHRACCALIGDETLSFLQAIQMVLVTQALLLGPSHFGLPGIRGTERTITEGETDVFDVLPLSGS
jgi:hypothetical protein